MELINFEACKFKQNLYQKRMGVKKLFGLSAVFFSHICGGSVRERALTYPNWSSKFERSRSMCVRWVVGESAGCQLAGLGRVCFQGALLRVRGCMEVEGALLRPRASAWGPCGAVLRRRRLDGGGRARAKDRERERRRGAKLAGRDFQMFRLHTDWPTRRCPAGARAHFCTLGAVQMYTHSIMCMLCTLINCANFAILPDANLNLLFFVPTFHNLCA